MAGIYFLHKNSYIHRDLKPENLLISDKSELKICDFGWTCQTDIEIDSQGFAYEGERDTYCGTLEYMAPEIINNNNYTHNIDTWALGILLFELVHGHAPFPGDQRRQI